jgi:hypothetical protein
MAKEYGATVRRLGTKLPADVAAFAERMTTQRNQRLSRRFIDTGRLRLDSARSPWRRAG